MVFKGCMNLLNQLRLRNCLDYQCSLPFFLKKKINLFFLNLHVTLFFLFSPLHINICVYILVLSEEPVQS